jgi:cysteine desulfurase/selenocysteine lyase
MEPFLGGGEMIRDVTLETATWNDPPWRFEAGTPAIAEAIGLAAAVDYLENVGMTEVAVHGHGMTALGMEALSTLPGIVIYGPTDLRVHGPVISFNLLDDRGGIIHPHDVSTLVDREGVAIRVGHHCAKPLMNRFGVPAMCRASFQIYNTPSELETLVGALRRTREFFLGGKSHAARAR